MSCLYLLATVSRKREARAKWDGVARRERGLEGAVVSIFGLGSA